MSQLTELCAYFDGLEYTKTHLQSILPKDGKYLCGFTVEVEYINIGCKKNIPVAKLKELIALL